MDRRSSSPSDGRSKRQRTDYEDRARRRDAPSESSRRRGSDSFDPRNAPPTFGREQENRGREDRERDRSSREQDAEDRRMRRSPPTRRDFSAPPRSSFGGHFPMPRPGSPPRSSSSFWPPPPPGQQKAPPTHPSRSGQFQERPFDHSDGRRGGGGKHPMNLMGSPAFTRRGPGAPPPRGDESKQGAPIKPKLTILRGGASGGAAGHRRRIIGGPPRGGNGGGGATSSTGGGGIGDQSDRDKDRGAVVAIKSQKNDYSQYFVDSGNRPQNMIRGSCTQGLEQYPKLLELVKLKDKAISLRNTPPYYMQCDLKTFDLTSLGSKFDVVLIDPPWEEYSRRAPGFVTDFWSFDEIEALRIDQIVDSPSFVFLWVGDAEGLDLGRLLLKKWGFRRAEDICWIKTNAKPLQKGQTENVLSERNSALLHTKEHCLMGIKGTVKRSTDGHIIHANVDTDLIISEELHNGSMRKPEELYQIIEHFSLGRRRLELFGEDHNIRPGWVTLGRSLSSSNYDKSAYATHFAPLPTPYVDKNGIQIVDNRYVGTTPKIEELRPRTPPRADKKAQQPPAGPAFFAGPPH